MENKKFRGMSSAGPKREPKDYKLNLRVSKTDMESINRISVEDDVPVAQVVRNAVRKYARERNERI